MTVNRKQGWGHPFVCCGLFFLAVLALLFGCVASFFALVFLGNFNLRDAFHFFVLVATFVVPVLSVAGFYVYFWIPNRVTVVISLLCSGSALALLILWGAEGARGLIH